MTAVLPDVRDPAARLGRLLDPDSGLTRCSAGRSGVLVVTGTIDGVGNIPL